MPTCQHETGDSLTCPICRWDATHYNHAEYPIVDGVVRWDLPPIYTSPVKA